MGGRESGERGLKLMAYPRKDAAVYNRLFHTYRTPGPTALWLATLLIREI